MVQCRGCTRLLRPMRQQEAWCEWCQTFDYEQTMRELSMLDDIERRRLQAEWMARRQKQPESRRL